MFVVLGASGHTGRVVAKTLLDQGQKVRVVGRNAERLRDLANLDAEVFVADVSDGPGLTKAFRGADAAYVLIPPNSASTDYRAFQERVSDAIAAAVQNSGIKRAVALSSFGADKANGTGPVVGLHNLEQKLNQIESVNVLYLRAGYFMENTLPQVAVVRMLGSVAGPVLPGLKLPMIATHDIGVAAAKALVGADFRGKQTRELQGQRDLTYVEAAAVIGKAIDKPSMGYVQVPDDQFRAALTQMGMSANMAGLILEMAGALNSGHMKALESRMAENSTPTSFESFVEEEFAPAYREQVAA
ncbi:MAG TPA: NAD(P)H-binding protein [Terriglobales bacterium]|nr:NAD(P)H-binding protein [Terriglobales bacterium]